VKILVTGGAGFIGSHLCEKLVSLGHEVSILDDFSTGSINNLESLKSVSSLRIVNGSILDKDLCIQVVKNSEYVFHLAAAVGVFNIVYNPIESLKINITGTENLVDAAKQFNVPFLFASSSEVYGKNSKDSLSEDDDRIIGSPSIMRWSYSEAKAIDESFVQANHIHHKLRTRIVRFFNTVGPRQVGQYGMVIPRFIAAALTDKPLIVYGNGTQKRCFLHVSDAIDAVLKVAFSENTVGKTINIGNDKEISILDLAHTIISITNSKSEIQFKSYYEAYGSSFEDMQRRVPNLNQIRQLVDWVPQKTLTQIITDIVKVY
jgi:UDP-glucose 4-epimerase